MNFKPWPKIVDFWCDLTAYFPPPPEGYASDEEAAMEGGALDRMGEPLCTLQDYLEGKAGFVSVAMDRSVTYGTYMRIPALDEHYKSDRPIEFRCVDTGGAFRGKGLRRMDICVRSRHDQYEPILNRTHRVFMIAQSESAIKA